MDDYLLLVLGAETAFLVVIVAVLLDKSHKLSKLFRDSTKLKIEEQHQEQIQRERDDYLAMLVHELRSPLSVIKGSADLVIKEAQNLNKVDIEKLLTQIRSSSSSLLNLVNDILDVSKIESGKFEIRRVRSNINTLLEQESDYYKALLEKKGLKLVADLEKNFPEFLFDPVRIQQVLNNLISNAIKFSPQDGIIQLESKRVDGSMRVCVIDNGPGIPDYLKPKLFHKFVQLQDPRTNNDGTGLGLVIAKGIVEAHSGKVWIEDNFPKGAKFCFTIPFTQ